MQSTIVRATRVEPFCDVIDRQLDTKWQRSLPCLRDFQTSIFDELYTINELKNCCRCCVVAVFPLHRHVDAFILFFFIFLLSFSLGVPLNYSETATHYATCNVLGATGSLACTRLWQKKTSVRLIRSRD